MATQATAQWWARAGGAETNGGGFDDGISGAGTNYCDQDAAQLSLTDLACTAAAPTTLTSPTGGFTSAMIGNCVRIDASVTGTNFIDGYFWITGHTDTNTVTIDRTCNNGSDASSGTGKIGGAFAHPFINFANGGTGTQPAVAAPQVGGNLINVRSGLNKAEPSTADAADWDFGTSYWTLPARTKEAGFASFKGYNGRPKLEFQGLCINSSSGYILNYLYMEWDGTTWASFGFPSPDCYAFDCLFDSDGNDVTGCNGTVINCKFRNSGSTTAGTKPAIALSIYAQRTHYNTIDSWRGPGIQSTGSQMSELLLNVISNVGSHALDLVGSSSTTFHGRVKGTSIYNPGGAGIRLGANTVDFVVIDNIIEAAGDYGVEYVGGASADELAISSELFWARNAIYNSGTADYNGVNKPAGDITLTASPFTNAAGGDFSINNTAGGGALCRGVARKIGLAT